MATNLPQPQLVSGQNPPAGYLPGPVAGPYQPATGGNNNNPQPQPQGQTTSQQTFPPPTGEQPLADSALPQWTADRHNVSQNSQAYAVGDFKRIFGRNPSASELATLSPAYDAGNGVDLNLGAGKANVASYFQQLSQSPQSLYQKQQADLTAKAPQYYDQVGQLFQQNLGRAATDAENTHFGMLLASGQDPYQIQQALQQTTEYQTTATQKFSDQLKTQLQQSNQDYFSKYILPSIQSNNAMAGRTQDSSGYQAQLASAAQQQNYNLNDYLAQVQAGGYQSAMSNNSQNYQQLLGQQYGLSNANISNQLANNASNTQYNQNLQMYQMQQQAYNNYLQRYGKTGNPALGAIQGGMSGAGAGAAFGPWGALAGGVLGAGLGAYGQSSGAARL